MPVTHPEAEFKKTMMKATMRRRVEIVIMVVLLIIASAHLCRLITGVDLMVGKTHIPLWVSLFGSVGPLLLVVLFWWSRPEN